MKKFAACLLAFSLVFSSVGTTVFFGGEQIVEARGYKSGKRGFNSNYNNKSKVQQNQKSDTHMNQSNTNKSQTATKKQGGFFSGGLMRGLFIGGLAGLLFGGLFSNLGVFGALLGFLVNAFAILIIVTLCIKIYQFLTRKKEKEDPRPWNS